MHLPVGITMMIESAAVDDAGVDDDSDGDDDVVLTTTVNVVMDAVMGVFVSEVEALVDASTSIVVVVAAVMMEKAMAIWCLVETELQGAEWH